jgi:hypothetical protein
VQLARTAAFTAMPAGVGVYNVVIPKSQFLLYQSAIVNGDLETSYKQPSEDVTGTIDFTTSTVQMRVVIAQRIHFEAGCVPVLGCAISDRDGVLAANLSGTMVLPDADGDGVRPERQLPLHAESINRRSPRRW